MTETFFSNPVLWYIVGRAVDSRLIQPVCLGHALGFCHGVQSRRIVLWQRRKSPKFLGSLEMVLSGLRER